MPIKTLQQWKRENSENFKQLIGLLISRYLSRGFYVEFFAWNCSRPKKPFLEIHEYFFYNLFFYFYEAFRFNKTWD